MTRGIYLDMVSAEDYHGSLLGKEIVPNLLHYESDFLAVFPKAKIIKKIHVVAQMKNVNHNSLPNPITSPSAQPSP